MSRAASFALISIIGACSLAPAVVAPRVISDAPRPNPPIHTQSVETLPASQSSVVARQQVIEKRLQAVQDEVERIKEQYRKKARVPDSIDRITSPNND